MKVEYFKGYHNISLMQNKTNSIRVEMKIQGHRTILNKQLTRRDGGIYIIIIETKFWIVTMRILVYNLLALFERVPNSWDSFYYHGRYLKIQYNHTIQ